MKVSRRGALKTEPARAGVGLYRHYKGVIYNVLAISILDKHGHGNPYAPRLVTYNSTQSDKTGFHNTHTEEDFLKPTKWPDGIIRPRFIPYDGKKP